MVRCIDLFEALNRVIGELEVGIDELRLIVNEIIEKKDNETIYCWGNNRTKKLSDFLQNISKNPQNPDKPELHNQEKGILDKYCKENTNEE